LSDEAYVVDLCDEILDEQALRQHRFDWLRGDQGHRLPVDAYYRRRRVVVEYRERQHEEPNPHFDKPHKLTVSGVHRGIQRKLYDHRRTELVPAHGLTLVVISPADLSANSRGRLRRDRTADKRLLSAKLGKHIGQS
jgi:very-short-patch-repair endonuclease